MSDPLRTPATPPENTAVAAIQDEDEPARLSSDSSQPPPTAPDDPTIPDPHSGRRGRSEPVVDSEVVGKSQRQVGLQVREIVASFAGRSGPAYHPIFEKFESRHVSQFLSQTHEADREERQIRRGNRWFRLAYVGIAVVIFLSLTFLLLPDHSVLYLEILKVIGAFVAGTAGGYGLRAYQERRPDRPTDS